MVAIWDGEQTTRFPHLINHQAEGGYYLPVEFAEPIWLEADEESDADDDDGIPTATEVAEGDLRNAVLAQRVR